MRTMILILTGLLMISTVADAQQRYMRDKSGTKQDTCRDRTGTNRCD